MQCERNDLIISALVEARKNNTQRKLKISFKYKILGVQRGRKSEQDELTLNNELAVCREFILNKTKTEHSTLLWCSGH